METPVWKTITIDATGQVPGRLAATIAHTLMGKHRADYAPNRLAGDSVCVRNVPAMKLDARRMENKEYRRHSGYPGGMSIRLMKDVFAKNPGDVLRKAVLRMLPNNRLRTARMKRLIIE